MYWFCRPNTVTSKQIQWVHCQKNRGRTSLMDYWIIWFSCKCRKENIVKNFHFIQSRDVHEKLKEKKRCFRLHQLVFSSSSSKRSRAKRANRKFLLWFHDLKMKRRRNDCLEGDFEEEKQLKQPTIVGFCGGMWRMKGISWFLRSILCKIQKKIDKLLVLKNSHKFQVWEIKSNGCQIDNGRGSKAKNRFR